MNTKDEVVQQAEHTCDTEKWAKKNSFKIHEFLEKNKIIKG